MNSYRPIPLNRAGGESYDSGQQMTMEEAQRIAQQYGHVAQRISSGAADPNSGYMGVYGVPTEQGFIPVDQLGGQGGPQSAPQQRTPMAGQSGPIANTINQWQSQGVPQQRPPSYNNNVASTATRQGAIANYAQEQPQEQVIWPAPPGSHDSPQYQSSGSMGVAAQMGQQRQEQPAKGPPQLDQNRYQFPQVGDRPMREIIGAQPPVMQNMPPSTAASQHLQPQSKHYQFDPNFYGPQQEKSGWEEYMPWNWGK